MSEAVIKAWPQAPYALQLAPGEYAWCRCGKTVQPPFCDARDGCLPLRFSVRARRNLETQWLCGCQRTGTPPYCDGSHNKKPR